MKALNVITLALAAFSGFASAQEPAAKPEPKLIVSVMNNKRWVNIPALDAQDKSIVYINPQTTEPAGYPVRAPYLIHTPKDLDAAMTDYRAGDLKSAMKQFAQVREKYQSFRALDGNPSMKAALAELDCAMRLQDWAAVTKVGEAIAGKTYGPIAPRQVPTVQAARYVAQALTNATDPEKAKSMYEGISKQQAKYASLGNQAKAENIGLRPYGWFCYCLGRLAEAQLPADQLQGGIAQDQLATANTAIDRLCQAAVAMHGAAPELSADAVLRALKLLHAMPGVKECITKAGGKMDEATWAKAPNDFKDAAAMAHLIKTVYAPELKDSLVDSLAALYVAPKPKAE